MLQARVTFSRSQIRCCVTIYAICQYEGNLCSYSEFRDFAMAFWARKVSGPLARDQSRSQSPRALWSAPRHGTKRHVGSGKEIGPRLRCVLARDFTLTFSLLPGVYKCIPANLRVNVLNGETYRGNNEKLNSAHTLGLGRP